MRALVFILALAAAACRPNENQPCFPAHSPDDVPWLSHQQLGWEIDEMAAIPNLPDADAPVSEVFDRAQRDLKTEFWLDAAKGLLAVQRGDTHDSRKTRQVAQYQLAVAIYRLHYYVEAMRVFRIVASIKGHPMREEAYQWTQRPSCG